MANRENFQMNKMTFRPPVPSQPTTSTRLAFSELLFHKKTAGSLPKVAMGRKPHANRHAEATFTYAGSRGAGRAGASFLHLGHHWILSLVIFGASCRDKEGFFPGGVWREKKNEEGELLVTFTFPLYRRIW